MKICPIISATAWQDRLPHDAAALQQSWAYGAAVEAMGREVFRAEITDQGLTLGVAQVLLRRLGRFGLVGLMSRGPIWCGEVDASLRSAALRGLRAALPGQGARLLLATSEEPDQAGLMPLYTAAHMAEVDLSAGPRAARQAFHGKWRNRLVKAEAARLRVQTSRDPDTLVALIEREAEQQRHKRYRSLPGRFIANWVRNDPCGFRIYRALMGNQPVAEMLFLDHAPGVTYQMGWSSGAGRTLSAHHLLLWLAIQDFADIGRLRMDLGTLDTVTAPGLARFKLGAGAKVRRLGQTGLVLPGVPWPGGQGRATSVGRAQ
ncbi:hypothetical protein AIOL_002338 [Candidatus Rhodobacter oscarellae]|uniref:BioF2-like acetyltransferase domain-containing protein n=1 Tax=Candidatus Rhodobacter oscarellae TaxID=1675527 RepID=A0A0J9E3L3_9RHOB|nr:GNAT family N-acetyltransferase [Candidatus Rhodobacter lobularis]KMW57375.1 hypothetical protein AIOL_002338 [Candidatus Rhodobacter lobularis]